jgi:carboxypeptidase C (cathepsin A)
MPIKNAVSGETEARVFYIAYTLDNPPARRPLMFSFNGGPGSASVWLHLGALGPRRIRMMDDGMMPPPPYQMEDNQETWLTETDIVFIDPVGTGYSRAARPDLASKFFGVNGDIESVGEVIRMYLGRNERWMSPLFLVGESYGTTRASGLSNWLFDHGIALNGIALVSTVMNFQTIIFATSNDLPLVLMLPSYTTTAWYHKKLPPAMQSKSVEQVADEWDGADGEVQRHVHQHPRHHDRRQAALRAAQHHEQAQAPGDDVTRTRDEPDQRVDADAPAGARDGNAVVQQPGQQLHLASGSIGGAREGSCHAGTFT